MPSLPGYGSSLLCGMLVLLLAAGEGQESHAQFSSGLTSDSTRWRVETSTGYYTLGVFVSVGRRLPTGFTGSFEFGIAQTYSRFGPRSPLFDGDRYYRSHYIFRLSFDYPLSLGRRHRLLLGTGIVYVKRYWTRPEIRIRGNSEGQIVLSGTSNTITPGVAGLHFTVKYQYRVSRVALGVRAGTHLFHFELGGEYIVAPLVTVYF